MEAAAVNRRDDHPAIIGNHEAVGIGRIDPDVVGIAAPADLAEILARIQRLVEGTVGDIHFVVGAARYREADVIAGASDQRPLRIDGFPMLARVIGSPKRTLILGLHQGVDSA